MFTEEITVNFYDCDPAGILFFGRIYELCHKAYEKMIGSFSLANDFWNNEKFAVPVIHSEADYFKPLKYGEEIQISISVTVLKLSSFELNYQCTNKNGDVCAAVKTVHVFVSKASWEKTPVMDELKEKLSNHLKKNGQ